jgi:hypothetical protein
LTGLTGTGRMVGAAVMEFIDRTEDTCNLSLRNLIVVDNIVIGGREAEDATVAIVGVAFRRAITAAPYEDTSTKGFHMLDVCTFACS